MATYLVMAPTYFLCPLYTLCRLSRRRQEHCSWDASGPAAQCIISRRASCNTRHMIWNDDTAIRALICASVLVRFYRISHRTVRLVCPRTEIEVTNNAPLNPLLRVHTRQVSTSTSTTSTGTSTLHTCTSALHGHMHDKLGLSRKSRWQYLLFSYR